MGIEHLVAMLHRGALSIFLVIVLAFATEQAVAAAAVADAQRVPAARACGQPAIEPETVELNVLGGRDAVAHSWPWQSSLHVVPGIGGATTRVSVDVSRPFCGAALIDNRTLVTAAHCVRTKQAHQLVVRLGAHRRLKSSAGELVVAVRHLCIYPNYTRGNVDDIAIVRLARPVRFSDTVAPVCLPAVDDEVDPDDDQLFVTGWGYTSAGWNRQAADVLQQARQQFVNKTECRRMRLANVTRAICTRHDLGSSCHGDSGGPLVLERDGRWQLQGVVSGGPPVCGLSSWPMYYTEVSKYRRWIDRYLAARMPRLMTGVCRP